jgi:hypothetical protein
MFFFQFYVNAQTKIEWNDRIIEAYNETINLKFDKANKIIESEAETNAASQFVYNNIDFLNIIINDDENLFKQLEKNKESRLSAIKNADKNSPFYNYFQAQILIQWAFSRVKYKQYFTAFQEINKAYKLLNENKLKFPDFKPNLMSLGMLHILIGSIPDEFKWGADLIGLKGNSKQGFEELEQCVNDESFIFKEEAAIYYGMFQMNLAKNPSLAWNVLQKNIGEKYKQSALLNFIMANMAMRAMRNNEAIQILKQKPLNNESAPFPYLEFMLGLAKLRSLDFSCEKHFYNFINQNKSTEGIKEAYEKLGWMYLLAHNVKKYWECNYYILNRGNTEMESDKAAYTFALKKEIPDSILIKSRLLFDGAYYAKALQVLKQKNEQDYKIEADKLEYNYRKGRILKALNKNEEAIQLLYKTLNFPLNYQSYIPAKSCLEIADIYEKKNDKINANKFYKEATKRSNHEYKRSFSHIAKAGIERNK